MKSVSTRSRQAALTALLAGLGLGLSGCGQKGPLSLTKPAAVPAAPAASTASAPSR